MSCHRRVRDLLSLQRRRGLCEDDVNRARWQETLRGGSASRPSAVPETQGVRVLVTGATGFVGYVVASALHEAGHDVVALTRSAGALPPGVDRLPGDLCDPTSLSGVARGRFD